MLTLRLQRVQLELASHRAWLHRFAVSRSPSSRRYASTDFDPVSKLAGDRPSGRSNRRQAGNVKAAVRKSAKQYNDSRVQQPQSDPVAESVLELVNAVRDYDIQRAIAAYKALPEKKHLEAFQAHSLAQCLHQSIRVELHKQENWRSREVVDEMVEFAIQLVKDIRTGRLQSSPPAHVHLMGVFKESECRSEGLEFWHWLEKQDDMYVDVNCYAVAIDMFARENTPMEDLDDLYSRALARFPGTFSAYHLAPNAILPDRGTPLGITALPTQLLQSITQARLMRGDTKSAYLGLDTVFRIGPTTVMERFARVFHMERPASEYYTVFAMFCRAGIPVAGVSFKALLASLRESFPRGDARSRVTIIRSILSALYLQLCSGGAIAGNSVGELTILMTQVLRHPGVAGLTSDARGELVNAVISFIRTTMEVFARYRILPPVSTFNALIANVGGYGRSKEVIGIASADMKRLGYTPNEVTRRSMLSAAGLIQDGNLVEKYWQELVAARRAGGTTVDGTDFRVLVTAVRRTGQEALARSALEQHKGELRQQYVTEIPEWMSEDSRERQPSASEIVDAGFLVQGIQNAQEDLDVIKEKTKERPAVQDLSNEQLPMALFYNSTLNIAETDMRKIYDEYTIEQGVQPQQIDESSAQDLPKSSTGLTFAELRYENWKSINYLLWLSNRHDNKYAARVDDAIAKKVRPPRRNMGIEKEDVQEIGIENFGMSNPIVKPPKTSSQEEVAKARASIARLRRTDPE